MRTVASRHSTDQLHRKAEPGDRELRGKHELRQQPFVRMNPQLAGDPLMPAPPTTITMHSQGSTVFAYRSEAAAAIIIRGNQLTVLKFEPDKLLSLLLALLSNISLNLLRESVVYERSRGVLARNNVSV